MRIWERGEDLVFIEEEREKAFEVQADQSVVDRDRQAMNEGNLVPPSGNTL